MNPCDCMQRCKVLLRSLWCFGQKDGGDSLGSEKGGRLFPVSGAEVALNSITFAEQVCVRVCVRESVLVRFSMRACVLVITWPTAEVQEGSFCRVCV